MTKKNMQTSYCISGKNKITPESISNLIKIGFEKGEALLFSESDAQELIRNFRKKLKNHSWEDCAIERALL